ncbi:MAG: hypothetical protein EBX62_03620 [Betaproteobacteria bacterium]|nr:hypothetical protein [Betaproteobacteria bacterium]
MPSIFANRLPDPALKCGCSLRIIDQIVHALLVNRKCDLAHLSYELSVSVEDDFGTLDQLYERQAAVIVLQFPLAASLFNEPINLFSAQVQALRFTIDNLLFFGR